MNTNSSAGYDAHHFDDALSLYKSARMSLTTFPPAETDAEEDDLEQLADALSAAEDYIFAHKAPDLTAVLAKFEIATFDGRVMEPAWSESIRADLIRLGRIERSPTFIALDWLVHFEQLGGRTALRNINGEIQAVLECPAGPSGAANRVASLRPHERAAVDEHLRQVLAPADYGLEAAQ